MPEAHDPTLAAIEAALSQPAPDPPEPPAEPGWAQALALVPPEPPTKAPAEDWNRAESVMAVVSPVTALGVQLIEQQIRKLTDMKRAILEHENNVRKAALERDEYLNTLIREHQGFAVTLDEEMRRSMAALHKVAEDHAALPAKPLGRWSSGGREWEEEGSTYIAGDYSNDAAGDYDSIRDAIVLSANKAVRYGKVGGLSEGQSLVAADYGWTIREAKEGLASWPSSLEGLWVAERFKGDR